MDVKFSDIQINRLLELGAKEAEFSYPDKQTRDKTYQKIEKNAIAENRSNLLDLIENTHQPKLCEFQTKLATMLCENGFTQLTTPTIISKKLLEKMTIDESTELFNQVFWLDNKTCLRPMLAPNLYEVSRKLLTIKKDDKPLRIFEIGSCFRKESEGKNHLKEFTMLNLVEWGTPLEERLETLKKFASLVLEEVGINDYQFISENSTVYGDALDIVGENDLELASTSFGPHKLDVGFNINSSWVGIGFGLERLIMYKEKSSRINRYSKSVSYLNGSSLNIK